VSERRHGAPPAPPAPLCFVYARGVRNGGRGGSPWAEFRNARTDQVRRDRNALLDIAHIE